VPSLRSASFPLQDRPGRAARPRLLIASANPGKLAEYEQLLGGLGLELVGCDPEVDEVGESYAANAALKAEAVRALTSEPALGDDSGLQVEPLDGFPGIRSARLGRDQAERQRLLFARLAGKPRPWRARFVCVLALSVPGAPTLWFRGEVEGEVVEPRSRGFGFGYDPVFLVPEAGKTFAEMAPEEKQRWSHRAAAVRALVSSGTLGRLAAAT
jgi:XTP/dITP diphosphohydrolase